MNDKQQRRAGDLLLDRYLAAADEATREKARRAFRDLALLIYRVGDRLYRKQCTETASSESGNGAILSEAPSELPPL